MKTYEKPVSSVVLVRVSPLMETFPSGWNVDGDHQGGVSEGGDGEGELPWGGND